MQKTLFFVSLLPLFINFNTNEKSTNIRGTIIDENTNAPIIATIRLINKWQYWQTFGTFNINTGRNNSQDTLVISATGYETLYYPFNQIISKPITIKLKPYLPQMDSVTFVNNCRRGREIVTEALNRIPSNYIAGSFCYEAEFQEIIYFETQDGILETYEGIVNIWDKGISKNNVTTNISPVAFKKQIHNPDWLTLREQTFTFGSYYNQIYKVYDCDIVRGHDSFNEFFKYTNSFFARKDILKKYDLILSGEKKVDLDSVYIIIAQLKPAYRLASINDMMADLDNGGREKYKTEIKDVNLTPALLSTPQKNYEEARILVNKSDFAFLSIEDKNHIAISPHYPQLIRGASEILYTKYKGKYCLDRVRFLDYTGHIGIRIPQAATYSELRVTKVLSSEEQKKVVKKNYIDRKKELYYVDTVENDSIFSKKVFKQLKPYF